MKENSNKLVIYNILSTMILYLITFISAPVFSRILGTEGYGIVQTYNAWAQFLTVIIGFSTRSTLPIAKTNILDSEIDEYESSALGLSSLVFLIFLTVGIIVNCITQQFQGFPSYLFIVMTIQCFGQYCIAFLNTIYTYDMKAKNNLVLSVATAVFNFVIPCIMICVFQSNKAEARILGTAIVYFVGGIISFVIVFKKGKKLFSLRHWKFCIPLCIPLIFHGFASVICSSSDRIMLSRMTSMSDVGIYALACNFAYIIDSIWNALHNSWDPIFMDLIKRGNYSEIKKRSDEYAFVFTGLVVGFLLLSPDVFKVFASEQYWRGIPTISWIVLSEFCTFIYAFGVNYEFAEKKTNMIAIGSVISAISNIFMNYVLIQLWSFNGAAISTFVSNALLAFIHICFAKRIAKCWVYEIWFFVKYILIVGISFLSFYFTAPIRWILAVIMGLLILMKLYKTKRIF